MNHQYFICADLGIDGTQQCVKWQDWNGFIRVEKDYNLFDVMFTDGYIFYTYHKYTWRKLSSDSFFSVLVMFLVVMPLTLLVTIPMWIIQPLVASKKRKKISINAYDIELTPNIYKLIKDKSGKIGICYWYNWFNCRLLLESKYENAFHLGEDAFVVKDNGKFGIYNAKKRTIVVPLNFSNMRFDGDFVILSNKDITEKFNSYGERIMI